MYIIPNIQHILFSGSSSGLIVKDNHDHFADLFVNLSVRGIGYNQNFKK